MELILYVGVLVNEGEDAEEDLTPEGPTFRAQFDAVNAELRKAGLPLHHEPTRLEEGDWWIKTTWDALDDLVDYAEEERGEPSEGAFGHLAAIGREQIALPVEFAKPIPVDGNPDILCDALISSASLMNECGEIAAALGLNPESYPLRSGEGDDPDAEREFNAMLESSDLPRDKHGIAKMCITLYHACELSIDSRAAIYFE